MVENNRIVLVTENTIALLDNDFDWINVLCYELDEERLH